MDYLAGILTLLGYYFIGIKKWYGWIFSLISNGVWIYIGVNSHLAGLILISIIMLIISLYNAIKWYK